MARTKERKSARKAGGGKRRTRAKPRARPGVGRSKSKLPAPEPNKLAAAGLHPPVDPERYPNLAAMEAWDREMHIRAAMAMGLTREQAERHVEEELAGAPLD